MNSGTTTGNCRSTVARSPMNTRTPKPVNRPLSRHLARIFGELTPQQAMAKANAIAVRLRAFEARGGRVDSEHNDLVTMAACLAVHYHRCQSERLHRQAPNYHGQSVEALRSSVRRLLKTTQSSPA